MDFYIFIIKKFKIMNKHTLIFKQIIFFSKSLKIINPSVIFLNSIINYQSKENFHSKIKEQNESYFNLKLLSTFGAFLGIIGYVKYQLNKVTIYAETKKNASEDILTTAGRYRQDLPNYKYDEISEHATDDNGIWVTFRDGVYDITNFILNHPGGSEKISMAAGGSVEPFWQLYGVHKTDHVLEILEEMRIGNVDPNEEKIVLDSADPFALEPKRHRSLKINVQTPFNAETPTKILVDQFTTPNELFFVRNHLPVPHVKEKQLKIEGIGIRKEIFLSIEELVSKFNPIKITSSVMCAGNRRRDMNSSKPVKGIQWGEGAISTAEWTGVKLIDILAHAGLKDWRDKGIKHVIFEGGDRDMDGSFYEASIPAETAFDPQKDVIIAYKMNGEDIPIDHGFPLRVIVPGTIGARQVKWLQKIILSTEESQSFWQQKDYKTYSPSIELDNADPSKSVPIQEFPVQSAICEPSNGSVIKLNDNKMLEVKGYAIAGGGRGILRVEISIDGGKTWIEAQLKKAIDQQMHKNWAWVIWTVYLERSIILNSLNKSKYMESTFQHENPEKNGNINNEKTCDLEILCKATDSSHNCQPESDAGIWNPRGLLSNKWHRIRVKIDLY